VVTLSNQPARECPSMRRVRRVGVAGVAGLSKAGLQTSAVHPVVGVAGWSVAHASSQAAATARSSSVWMMLGHRRTAWFMMMNHAATAARVVAAITPSGAFS
jgi:hypothetical protein